MCVVFWCYKAYKIGSYFICPKGKIFGAYISYVKIRRAMAPEWVTIKQSGNQKERNTLIINRPRGSSELETPSSNFPYSSLR